MHNFVLHGSSALRATFAAAMLVGHSAQAQTAQREHEHRPYCVVSPFLEASAQQVQLHTAEELHAELIAEIWAYDGLENGWDGDAALRPTQEQLLMLECVVAGCREVAPLPRPMISAGGSVGLYWNFGSGYADVEVDRDGTVSMFTKRQGGSSGDERYFDNLTVGDSIDIPTIQEELRTLVSDAGKQSVP